MSSTKKFLKHIRENAAADLPTHPSDAASEIPDSLSDKMGARAVKPAMDGKAAAEAAAKKSTASKVELPEESVEEESHHDAALPIHPSDAAAQVPDHLKMKAEEADEDSMDAEKAEDEKEEGDSADSKKAEMKAEDASISEDEDKKLSDEEEKEMKENVSALTSDEVLPESFKEKVASIFEAAVKRTAKKRVDAHKKALVETYNQKLAANTQQISETLVNKVDAYLDYVVEEWMKENEVAIEGSLRSEVTDKFISGLKGLFESHYIEIPAEKTNVISVQEAKIASLEKTLNEELAKSVEIRKENIQLKKEAIVKKHTEGLTVSDAAKFAELCEGVSYDAAETFSQKLKVIKETYFPKSPKCSGDLDASLLIEGGLQHEETASSKTEVDFYAETISRMVKR